MFYRVNVSCRILYSIVSYLYVSCSRSVTVIVLGRDSLFVCYRLHVIMWFLFGEMSSSSGCLGRAALFIVPLPEPSI